MSMLKSLMSRREALSNQAKALYAEIEAKGDKATADDTVKLNNILDAGDALVKQIELARKLVTEDADAPEALKTGAEAATKVAHRSIGEAVVKSDVYRNLPRGAKSMPSVEVKADEIVGVTGIGSTQAFPVWSQRLSEILPRPRIGLDLLDLIPSGQTNSNSLEYMQHTTRTNNAAETQELSAKPQSVLDWSLVTAPVRTIPTYVVASRQVLDDEPRLRGMIDDELLFMVRQRLNSQLLNGDGTGVNLTGILNAGSLPTRAHGSGARSDASDNKMDTIKRAITDIKLALFAADGILLNPADAEEFEVLKDVNGRYIAQYDAVSNRLWRVPIVEHTVITAGTALVGQFSIGAKYYMRSEVTIEAGYVNDQFTKNQFTILAELRAAMTVPYVDAFVKVTGL